MTNADIILLILAATVLCAVGSPRPFNSARYYGALFLSSGILGYCSSLFVLSN